MKMGIQLAVLLSLLGVGSMARAQLYCAHNGSNWQPRNDYSNTWIGKYGYGFSATQSCESSISAAGRGSVCNWNGSNYQPYSISSGGAIGKVDYGFSSFDSCKRATQNDVFGVICQWNGSNYQPHNSASGTPIGKPDYGFSSFDSCVRTGQAAVNGVTCNWNGSNYQPYLIYTNQFVGNLDYGYSQFNDCLRSSERAQRGICNWDGAAWSAYSLHQPSQVMRSFANLNQCQDFTGYGTPAANVALTVDGQSYLTTSPGRLLTYQWSTQGVQSVVSYYTANRGDTCPGGITDEDIANGITKPWVVNVPNESKTIQAEVQSCQSGVTYTITVDATLFDGSHRSRSIRIQVY